MENQSNEAKPSLATMAAFLRAVEAGSFAAAARQLGMTPAALGQSVGRLEAHLGVRLLNRTTRRMHPTSDGRRLAEQLRAPLAELEEVQRSFLAERDEVAGVLRVSAPLSAGRRLVLPLAAKFRQRHPAVQFEFDFSDVVRDFAESELDLAFRILRPVDSALTARPISTLDAVTIASPAYVRRRGSPRHPRELDEHEQIAYRHVTSAQLAPFVFRIGGRDVRHAPRPTLVVNDVDAGCEAAVLGMGLCQPPSDAAAPLLASGRVVEVLKHFRAAPWRLFVCYPATRRLPKRVRTFVEFALEELGRDRLAGR